MKEIKYIDVINENNETISLRKDIGLYYLDETDKKYYTLSHDFKKTFNNDLEYYMLTSYEVINYNNFSKEDVKLMKNNNYEGKFIYKVVTKEGNILNHYYTFIGMENKEELKVVPFKIPYKNKYTVDPRNVISTTWYYIEGKQDKKDYITLKNLIEEIEEENSKKETKKETKKTKKTKKKTKKTKKDKKEVDIIEVE